MEASEVLLHPQTWRYPRNEERLRQAVIQEFAQHGLHRAKVSTIVALAQLSFYRVWPSKEAAFNDIIESTNTRWRQTAAQSLTLDGAGPLSGQLERGVLHFFRVLTANMNLTRLVLAHNRDSEQHSLYVRSYARRLQDMQDRGQIRSSLSPEVLGQVYSALIERFLLARVLQLGWTLEQVAHELTGVLLHLLMD